MPSDKFRQAINELRAKSNPEARDGMARFGISTNGAVGVSMPYIRRIAKEMGKDQELALELWESGIHEARILAGLIAEPSKTRKELMERWAADFDSWDVCDQVCSCLFVKTPYAFEMAVQWTRRDQEFVKRAGFVLIAQLAVHDKKIEDARFLELLPLIVEQATDERNYVKKAVNWALRQIGKRNAYLNKLAIEISETIKSMDSRSARWIAADALRELRNPKTLSRIEKRQGRYKN